MTIIAFAGPSLTSKDRALFPTIEWRAPAEAGDLLTLVSEPGLTVCVIDGYFDHRPAVRHKEILLLLSEGVRIYGASSIGALRAAEMSSFGMIGIGSIYRAYVDGRIVGDDEVALVHATSDWDWKPLSLPLVDLRATLCRALRESFLNPLEARGMLRSAREIHYVDRNWNLVLECSGLAQARRDAFRAWLAEGEVAQKNLDAKACLRTALSDSPQLVPRPPAVSTDFLRALARERGISLEGRL